MAARHIALYGKGGSGKSTIAANLAVLFAQGGRKVLLVGCDPKHDTSQKVCDRAIPTILDRYLERADRLQADDFLIPARHGITVAEAGGPEPGIGCAGRGISKAFELFESCGVRLDDYDVVLYDVLGDVVCGGFAVPLRSSGRAEILIVMSGEIMALYAANNICKAVDRLRGQGARLAGFVGNLRGLPDEERVLDLFARRLGGRLLPVIPRDPAVIRAERVRQTVVEHAPDSPLADRYRDLFREVDSLQPGASPIPHPLSDLGFEEFVRQVLYAGDGP